MQVISNRHGTNPEETLHVPECLLKRLQRLEVLHVADMLAQNGIVFLRQAQRILQFASASENLLCRRTKVDGMGSIAAGPTQGSVAPFKGAHYRVVDSRLDSAVVDEEIVGKGVKSGGYFFVAADDGFFRKVPGGHHERIVSSALEEKMMERGIGEHDADPSDSGRHV